MNSIAVLGAQWGDEGKGKITDHLAAHVDYVVRFQGGNNAGHTINVDGVQTILHVVPSGILHPHCVSIIDQGVVLDPQNLSNELTRLNQAGVRVGFDNFKISFNTPIITSYHKILDGAREGQSDLKIGTTKRGIGPCYEDMASRKAILVRDFFMPEVLKKKLALLLEEKECLFKYRYQVEYPSVEEEFNNLMMNKDAIVPYACDTFSLLKDAEVLGKKVLYEGAQGLLLDNNFGQFPFVTSSNTAIGGIYTGCFTPKNGPEKILGIVKAYQTRVGEGPFPTELKNETGNRLRKEGHEYGATTGRDRRCGWLDLPLLKYAIKAGHFNTLAMTKLDVLENFKTIKICTHYMINGKMIDCASPSMDLYQVTPVYREFKVIKGSNVEETFKEYIEFIENETGLKIDMIGFGPKRTELVNKWEAHATV